MIELLNDALVFTFPEVHPSARLRIAFERTLRIPDDNREYPLPPGLGNFPLRHVDDSATLIPKSWLEHGGVMMPMYQSEAMWLSFVAGSDAERGVSYPFAVQIATGKINAVSGKPWSAGLHRRPQQNYVVVPEQPWLDGYCVERGIIRQFVAMPLGAGYTDEEQITGKAEHGGLQIMAFPMKRKVFERRFPEGSAGCYSVRESAGCYCQECPQDMGLAPGGRMRQNIYEDPYALADWDRKHSSRCFVHIVNSMDWRQVTGDRPPTTPFTAAQYTEAGLPWFNWYDDENTAIRGSDRLASLKSVAALAKGKGDHPIQDNETINVDQVVNLRRTAKPGQVREFKG